jgi:aryl-alcohol dehydrogenase-like predicted oxidoreductase
MIYRSPNPVNKVALGTVQFGLDYGINNKTGKVDKREVSGILHYAKQVGIDMLDTAFMYGDSESVLGKCLAQSNLDFNIVSKYPDKQQTAVAQVVEESLARLEVKSLYGYLFHSFDTYRQNPELWKEFEAIKELKKVRKIGFSLYYPSELDMLLHDKIRFDIVQLPYSIFDRRFECYFSLLKEADVEICVRSVFLQGLFFKKPEELNGFFLSVKDKIIELRKLSASIGLSVAEICINFTICNSDIDRVVIGVDSLQNLVENIEGLGKCKNLSIHVNELRDLSVTDEQIILPFNWKL